MPFRVSGKNLDLGEALRERINARIAQAVGKYFDGGYSGHVTLAKDGFGFRTECAIHLDSEDRAAYRRHGAGRLCQRRPGGAADRETAAPLPPPAQGARPSGSTRRPASIARKLCHRSAARTTRCATSTVSRR